MPKTKKRKGQDLYNLLGVGESQQENNESLDDLMAEMDGTSAAAPEAMKPLHVVASESSSSNDPWDLTSNVVSQPKNKDRIHAWNNSLRIWIKTGAYVNELLPNFDVEMARHFQVEKLSGFLLKKSDVKMPTFERWLIDSKIDEDKAVDPVLPQAEASHNASQRLLRELSEKMTPAEAQQVVEDLCRQTTTAIQELVVKQRRAAERCPLRKSDRIDVEDRDDDMMALLYRRKGWKKPYCIKLNVSHYQKLKSMYEKVHGDIRPKGGMHAFHLIVMCLLLRYSSLSGGQLLNDLRGGGMQGAIHPHVFRTLHHAFGAPCVETFASPLNAYYPQFGSAFHDLDWHFGSVGNFFEKQKWEEGCYEANPPFSPGLMTKMATYMQAALMHANDKKQALTFIVIVPSVSATTTTLVKEFASPSFDLLCKLSSQHIVLKSREHGYVEGAQHMKPTRYKESPYDTSVFVLQSATAAASRMAKEELEKQVREAFSSKHMDELQARKKTTNKKRKK